MDFFFLRKNHTIQSGIDDFSGEGVFAGGGVWSVEEKGVSSNSQNFAIIKEVGVWTTFPPFF